MYKYKMIFALTLLIFSGSAFGLEYLVYEAETAPVIDGNLSAGEWDGFLVTPIVYPDIVNSPYEGSMYGANPSSAADLSGDCYITWDSDYLYAAVRVYDDVLIWTSSPSDGWNDRAQFGIDPNNGRGVGFYEMVADLSDGSGPAYSQHAHSDFDAVTAMDGSVLADGYFVEIQLSWDQMGLNAGPGDLYGTGFVLIDTDSSSASFFKTLISDSSDNGSWSTFPGTQNLLRLVRADGCGSDPLDNTDLDKDCMTDLSDFAIFANEWMECTDPNAMAGCL